MPQGHARHLVFLSAILGVLASIAGCSKDAQAVSPAELQSRYGVTGAYVDTLATPDGQLRGTVVPVTLADGRPAQLIIPTRSANDPHVAYMRDDTGWHPVEVRDGTSRAELVQSTRVVERRVERAHPRRRSWEKEALIIGGGAGGGALVGALAGGKKGAGVGAAAGGIGGLIYDLATRNK
jgi:hypothetical protein